MSSEHIALPPHLDFPVSRKYHVWNHAYGCPIKWITRPRRYLFLLTFGGYEPQHASWDKGKGDKGKDREGKGGSEAIEGERGKEGIKGEESSRGLFFWLRILVFFFKLGFFFCVGYYLGFCVLFCFFLILYSLFSFCCFLFTLFGFFVPRRWRDGTNGEWNISKKRD